MNEKRDLNLFGTVPDSATLRIFRKQLLFWGGLSAVALFFLVYGTFGKLPFPGDFSRSPLRRLIAPGTIGQLVLLLMFFIALLLVVESYFALRFVLQQRRPAGYITGFSCEITPLETPFESPGPARSVFFVTGIYGRSFLLSPPLHGDVAGVVGRDAMKLLPPGQYTVTVYEKRHACHPAIPGWPLCLLPFGGNRTKTAPLPEDPKGEYVLIEGDISLLWPLCLGSYPFAFPHRMSERSSLTEWPYRLAGIDTAVAQAQARAEDTGKPVVVARKVTTFTMY